MPSSLPGLTCFFFNFDFFFSFPSPCVDLDQLSATTLHGDNCLPALLVLLTTWSTQESPWTSSGALHGATGIPEHLAVHGLFWDVEVGDGLQACSCPACGICYLGGRRSDRWGGDHRKEQLWVVSWLPEHCLAGESAVFVSLGLFSLFVLFFFP